MISIIIPAYNEVDSILDTIERCKVVLTYFNSNSEIIVVDDSSRDSTYEIARSTTVKILRHPQNMGYGRSLKDGIKAAKNDIIVIIDADGTYPIQDIPKLVSEYQKGFDMVVGARQGKKYYQSFMKKIYRGILKFLVEFTTGRKIDDINSGLRVFSRATAINFFDTLCDTFSFTTSITLAYMMSGKFLKYIPIEYYERVGETKVNLFRDSLRTFQFIIEAILYYNPVKIYLIFCMILIIFSILNLILAFFTKLKIAYLFGVIGFLLIFVIFGLGLLSMQLKLVLKRIKE